MEFGKTVDIFRVCCFVASSGNGEVCVWPSKSITIQAYLTKSCCSHYWEKVSDGLWGCLWEFWNRVVFNFSPTTFWSKQLLPCNRFFVNRGKKIEIRPATKPRAAAAQSTNSLESHFNYNHATFLIPSTKNTKMWWANWPISNFQMKCMSKSKIMNQPQCVSYEK